MNLESTNNVGEDTKPILRDYVFLKAFCLFIFPFFPIVF